MFDLSERAEKTWQAPKISIVQTVARRCHDDWLVRAWSVANTAARLLYSKMTHFMLLEAAAS